MRTDKEDKKHHILISEVESIITQLNGETGEITTRYTLFDGREIIIEM